MQDLGGCMIINKIAEKLLSIHVNNNLIYTAGNGGSSSTASHFTNDLIKGCSMDGKTGIRSVCLTDSSSVLTCLSNDYSYEEAIMLHLKTLARSGDCLVVFSGSGNSENIIRVAKFAKSAGITVIGFLGRDGGVLKSYCDKYIIAHSDDMEEIEDMHLKYVHEIKKLLREKIRTSFGMEIIKYPSNKKFKYAIFDFDGTISLIRQGWQDIMIPNFVEVLSDTPIGKKTAQDEIQIIVKEFVDRLTGKKTLFQCIELNEWVVKYGGKSIDPLIYKKEYLRRLMSKIEYRRTGLENGTVDSSELLIAGAKQFLSALKESGIELYCASGTDEDDVKFEAHLLGIDTLFGDNIYGARDDQGLDDTKELVIKNIIANNNLSGAEMLVFGDGMVEIELCKKVGGYAVAVASDEIQKTSIDEWKRQRLLEVGADLVIPHFADNNDQLLNFLLKGEF